MTVFPDILPVRQGAAGGAKPAYDLRGRRVFVAGHAGMVGSALSRRLQAEKCTLLAAPRGELDLRSQKDVAAFMRRERPDTIIIAAATVGGILANRDYPADFLYDNLMIGANLIHAAYETGVEKLLFLGSSCIYPRLAPQPVSEHDLLGGALEPTNEAYAIAKIAGLKLCQSYRRQHGCDFIAAMPCNLYGPGDRFDAARGHVIPALIMKFHEAREKNLQAAELWGTGTPLREFLYADDLADALVFLLKHYSGASPVNIGSGHEISIASLAEEIARLAGFEGRIVFNAAMPDGTPRKLLDSSRLRAMGWQPATGLGEGLRLTYQAYAEALRAAA